MVLMCQVQAIILVAESMGEGTRRALNRIVQLRLRNLYVASYSSFPLASYFLYTKYFMRDKKSYSFGLCLCSHSYCHVPSITIHRFNFLN